MTNLSQSLTQWYSHNKRDLPWRDTKNPYNIWVSEIILQQTRVNQGLSYYYRFIEKFPDIDTLANSDIDDLLKIWQGLGYYSRARNMHFTAKEIVEKYNGNFPSNYKELLQLKGIGDYTASAIASICFDEKTPVLDGNVFRVLSRFFGISESTQTNAGKKIFKEKLQALIPEKDPGTFNQSIMEFGAIQCTPKNPDCYVCTLKMSCFAKKNDLVDSLPLKKEKVKQQNRYFNYLYIKHKDNVLVEKRTGNDIWKLLYQFPLIETKQITDFENIKNTPLWKSLFNDVQYSLDLNIIEKKHILSHQKIYARFYKIEITHMNDFMKKNYIKIHQSEFHKIGVPRLIDRYLKDVNKS